MFVANRKGTSTQSAELKRGRTMPFVEEDALKTLLANGRINAISVDTSIFDQKRLNLDSAVMQAMAGLRALSIDFIMSGLVAKEVKNHLQRSAQDALQQAKKSIGKVLFSYQTEKPTRDEILEQITGAKSAEDTSNDRWMRYLSDTGCQLIDDQSLVDTSTLFDAYFAGDPPFGTQRKKDEFPDTLALHALERTAAERGSGMLIVSKDHDWRAFCEKSANLYIVSEIERALAWIRNAPLVLKKALHTWLVEQGDGADELFANIASRVENIDFSASAYPSFGEAEISTWDGELRHVEWPNENEIDVIDFEDLKKEALRLVVSMPLELVVKVVVELDFSVWDSVDKESVSMGGRSVEIDEYVTVRSTVTAVIHCPGTEDQEIIFEDVEIDDLHHEIELGEVDVFEPEEN